MGKPVDIKTIAYVWINIVFVLIVNIAVVLLPIFLNIPIIQTFIKPVTCAVILLETLFYLWGSMYGSFSASPLRSLTIPVFVFTFFYFLFSKDDSGATKEDHSEHEQNLEDIHDDAPPEQDAELPPNSNQQQEENNEENNDKSNDENNDKSNDENANANSNQDNQNENNSENSEPARINKNSPQEASQHEENNHHECPNTTQNQATSNAQNIIQGFEQKVGTMMDSAVNKLSDVKLETALYVLSMDIFYMFSAIMEFAGKRTSVENYGADSRDLINGFFVNIFRFATINYAYANIVNSTNIPRWLYFVYMIPQAALWSFAVLIAYYVNQTNSETWSNIRSLAGLFLGGMNLGKALKYIFTLKGDQKSKLMTIGTFSFIFLWFIFIMGIGIMNNEYENGGGAKSLSRSIGAIPKQRAKNLSNTPRIFQQIKSHQIPKHHTGTF